jgi:hypothetical protein
MLVKEKFSVSEINGAEACNAPFSSLRYPYLSIQIVN